MQHHDRSMQPAHHAWSNDVQCGILAAYHVQPSGSFVYSMCEHWELYLQWLSDN